MLRSEHTGQLPVAAQPALVIGHRAALPGASEQIRKVKNKAGSMVPGFIAPHLNNFTPFIKKYCLSVTIQKFAKSAV